MKGATKRLVRTQGVGVDLYRFEDQGSDSRGTIYSPTSDSPETITAIPDPGGKSVAYGVFGVEVDADMVYLVDEDVALEDGGGEGASVIVQDGKQYRVISADRSQPHGLAVLECELDPEADLS
jgi:hypothetical protein